jgi:uncharacterized protein YjbJ (UPF0337 family)
MNTQLIKGNWEKIKGSMQQKFAQLTDNDLMYAKGKESELIGRIQQKLGLTKEAVELFIKEHAEKVAKQGESKK